MLSEAAEFVIQGITVEGDIFKPEDWAERLCGLVARAGADGRKTYSSYVHPVVTEGIKSVVVRVALQKADPEAFDMIKRYIAENRLMVRSGRGSRDAEASEPLPVIGKERRDPNRNNW
jgi:hypothetical protein